MNFSIKLKEKKTLGGSGGGRGGGQFYDASQNGK
jgi:hypothetical protein